MKYRLFLIMLFSCISLYSQYDFRSGYIVKLDGSIEEGFINMRGNEFNSKECEFKKDANANSVIYIPGEISAYRFTDSKYFISKKLKIENSDTVLFLECLISGKATVYYTKWNTKDYYFIEVDDIFKEINNNEIKIIGYGQPDRIGRSNQYKGVLKYLFRNCPPVIQKIENIDFSKKAFIEISKEYHNYVCKDEQCVIYEKKIPKNRISFGIDFSYGITKLKFNQNAFGYFTMNSTWQYQVNVNSQIKLDEQGTYYLKISLGYYSYKNELINNTTLIQSASTPNDVSYQFSVLKPAIQLIYKFKTRKIIPFASVGVFSPILLNDRGNIYSHNFNKTFPFTSAGINKEGSMLMYGALTEIGLETRMKPGNFSLSFFYENIFAIPFNSSYNLGLRCGYSFHL